MDSFYKYLGTTVLGTFILVLTSAFCGFFFWLAWGVLAPLFAWKSLTFVQAWALNYVVNSFVTSVKWKEIPAIK